MIFKENVNTYLPADIAKFTLGITNAMERITGDFLDNQSKITYPPFNIKGYEDGSYEVTLAVAGMTADDITIETANYLLMISGDKKTDENDGGTYLHKGISTRKFSRQFALAENHEVEKASIKDGLLTVFVKYNVPEKLATKTHKIEVLS